MPQTGSRATAAPQAKSASLTCENHTQELIAKCSKSGKITKKAAASKTSAMTMQPPASSPPVAPPAGSSPPAGSLPPASVPSPPAKWPATGNTTARGGMENALNTLMPTGACASASHPVIQSTSQESTLHNKVCDFHFIVLLMTKYLRSLACLFYSQ